MKKTIENAKSVTIALLVISMLFLWTKNMQLHFLSDTTSESDTVTLNSDFWIFTDSTDVQSKITADPDYFSPLAVTLVANGRAYSSTANKDLTATLWENELPLVLEIFSSSYRCTPATPEEWENALLKNSFILIDFAGALPYSTLCAFNGKTSDYAQGDFCLVESLLLYPDENDVVSALTHDDKGGVYSFKTTLDKASALIYNFNSNNLTAYTVNTGFTEISFTASAPKDESGILLPAHHKILSSTPSLSPVHIENTVSSFFDSFLSAREKSNLDLVSNEKISALLGAFDINPTTVGVYTDANSRLIFINPDTRLVLSQKGVIEYAVSNEGEAKITLSSLLESERTQFSSAELLAAATAFVNSFKNEFIGEDAELLLENISYSDGKTEFSFGYYNNLCPVRNTADNSQITIVFDSRGLIEAYITPLVISDAREEFLEEPSLVKANVKESLALTLVSLKPSSVLRNFYPTYLYSSHNTSVYPIWAASVERE